MKKTKQNNKQKKKTQINLQQHVKTAIYINSSYRKTVIDNHLFLLVIPYLLALAERILWCFFYLYVMLISIWPLCKIILLLLYFFWACRNLLITVSLSFVVRQHCEKSLRMHRSISVFSHWMLCVQWIQIRQILKYNWKASFKNKLFTKISDALHTRKNTKLISLFP